MKYLIKSLPKIEKKIHSYSGCLLMLDFDGTLSALAKTPTRALLSKKNKLILRQISRFATVVIVTGRSLTDIEKRVGLKELIYAGNHGLEWNIAGKHEKIKIPVKMTASMNLLNNQLGNLCKRYNGSLLENKGLGLSLHYRLVSLCLVGRLLKEARRLINPFQKKRLLKITENKKTLDIQPALSWNKGSWVNFFYQKLGKRPLPIYIGDDITDEDVFNILRSGITIKVGQNHDSKANYYCHFKQVNSFLGWLLNKLQGD